MGSATAPLSLHLRTAVAYICIATGLALLPSVYPVTASVFGLLAFFLAMTEVSTFTSSWQFTAVYLSALITGMGCSETGTLPVLCITLFITATGCTGRILFFRTLGYTGYSFFEPVLFTLALAAWIGTNLLLPFNLAAWLVPLPMLVLQAMMAMGILKDRIQLLRFTKGGYKIAIGAAAPEFSLPDQEGKEVMLSSFRNQRHLLLVFVRGDWCPGCHMMLRTYQKEAAQFRTKNIFVLAIGPDPVGVNREMVEKLGLDFKVLSDEKQKTAMVYGVQLDKYEHQFEDLYDEGVPLPASFLIDKTGVVRYVSRPDKVGEFLDPRTIFPIIDRLT
jgi:peroxiredoxin